VDYRQLNRKVPHAFDRINTLTDAQVILSDGLEERLLPSLPIAAESR